MDAREPSSAGATLLKALFLLLALLVLCAVGYALTILLRYRDTVGV